MSENQKRTVHYSFKATPEEDEIIQKKMELAGIKNQSAFIRRIVLGGFILRLDLPETLYVHFKEIVKKMGRPEVRFHDVRHTFATLSLQSHVDPKTLSEALGHATVAFTLDVYGHSNEDMKQQAADQLEQLICQY